ncbi:hypothetical protein [Streptomyces sp. B21-083]
MTLRLACHWAATAGSALAADIAALGFTAGLAVCLIGYAVAPDIRKERRP